MQTDRPPAQIVATPPIPPVGGGRAEAAAAPRPSAALEITDRVVVAAAAEGFNPEAWQAAAISRLLLSHPHQTKPGCEKRRERLYCEREMTGGFAFVAYPERYGDTGIATFIINQNGIVYEKNLGKDTAELAKAMTEFNPDKTWNPVPE
jgi:Protein of unknown function (DUF2950)